MSKKAFNLVALAIEITECSIRAMDNTREKVSSNKWSSSDYTLRVWAADMLYQLPDDREKALEIVKAHVPGGVDPDNRRRAGQLCGRYYRRLKSTGLLRHGERFLKIIG
ncbi:MAG: hypothetical protein QM483_03130 [Desulfuromusa sp.]